MRRLVGVFQAIWSAINETASCIDLIPNKSLPEVSIYLERNAFFSYSTIVLDFCTFKKWQ